MVIDFLQITLYQPLYNGLVFLIGVLPWGDVGLAVIILTVFVKLVLLPLTHKSTKSQAKIKEIEPEVKKIKEQFKNDKQKQSTKTMELYAKHGVNPFSGCLLLIIQMPIIAALYFVFWKGLTDGLDESNLYSFIEIPNMINMRFLGFIDMSEKSVILALLAGVSQYFQMKYSPVAFPGASSDNKEARVNGKLSFKEEFAKSFRFQMKYGFPVAIFFISYTISAAVALYWFVSNVFSIGSEYMVRKKIKSITNESSEKTPISL